MAEPKKNSLAGDGEKAAREGDYEGLVTATLPGAHPR